MLQEPLLVVGAFYILFFTVIVYVRLDFSITKVWLVPSAAKLLQAYNKRCLISYYRSRHVIMWDYTKHTFVSLNIQAIRERTHSYCITWLRNLLWFKKKKNPDITVKICRLWCIYFSKHTHLILILFFFHLGPCSRGADEGGLHHGAGPDSGQ